MSNSNTASLEQELTALLSDVESAAKILRRVQKLGVLSTTPQHVSDSGDFWLCYRRWSKGRRGDWSGAWEKFALIVSHIEYTPPTQTPGSYHYHPDKIVVDGIRWGEDVASPGAFLARLIAKHRAKMQSVESLSETFVEETES
jgi:hypothetical protein